MTLLRRARPMLTRLRSPRRWHHPWRCQSSRAVSVEAAIGERERRAIFAHLLVRSASLRRHAHIPGPCLPSSQTRPVLLPSPQEHAVRKRCRSQT
eukprot:scaffold118917_cov26-Tisochrysis_lutea.AAC.3